MKISRPKTESYHNYQEGNCGSPIDRHSKHLCYYKKGDWKRIDRKKYLRNIDSDSTDISEYDIIDLQPVKLSEQLTKEQYYKQELDTI